MTVAWISDYPMEWMTDAPPELKGLPRGHPATWMPVLLEEFQRRTDLKVHVVTLRKRVPHPLQFERNGATFWVLRTIRGLRAPLLFWQDTLLIRSALRKIRPDLVHAWGTERGAALVASRLGRPYLVTIQGLLSWYRELIPFGAHDRLATWLEAVSLRRASVVTTESTFAVHFLRERFPHLRIRQAEHAPNRLFRQVMRSPQTQPVRFLAVGSIGFRKGSDLLLRALATLCGKFPFELRMVGSPEAGFLEPLRSELPEGLWRRVTVQSDLQPADVAGELARATIAVLPTRADTSPNAVKEAVVAGVPVVATRIGGIPDYVFEGENGLLCPSDEVTALADALWQAATHPLFSKGQVLEATLSRARDYLAPERMADNFFEAYRDVLGQRSAK